jgi:hypothetical protein
MRQINRESREGREYRKVASVRRKTGKGVKGKIVKQIAFSLFPVSPLATVTPRIVLGEALTT